MVTMISGQATTEATTDSYNVAQPTEIQLKKPNPSITVYRVISRRSISAFHAYLCSLLLKLNKSNRSFAVFVQTSEEKLANLSLAVKERETLD